MKSANCHRLGLYSLLALTVALPTMIASAAVPSDGMGVCPRASLLSHWRRLFPTTTAIPPFLLSRSSPLTATQLATFSSYIDANTLNTPPHLLAFCSAANVLCSVNLQPPRGFEDSVSFHNGFMHWNMGWSSAFEDGVNSFRHWNEGWASAFDKKYIQTVLVSGLYFREASIITGQKIHVPDIREKMPKASFLPKHISDKLPFSSKSLVSLMELLGVSSMERAMSETLSTCEVPPMEGERKICVRSIEDMADFVAAEVGQKAKVLVTQSADGCGQEATVGKVVAMNGGKETATVGCHRSMFPYLVYYCHKLPRVKVYHVELLIGNSAEKKNHAVAVCHMDTSKFNPNHLAFLVLGPGPGKIEVCHFMSEGEVAWVALD